MSTVPAPQPSSRRTAASVLDGFTDLRVLVVGDLVLDEWLYGSAGRLCREAPVPVVDVRHVHQAAGEAGNAAANAGALGAQVTYVGIVGDDTAGDDLRRILGEQGVDVSHVCVDAGRATPTKRRLVSDNQVVARFDVSDRGWSDRAVRQAEERAFALMPDADVVILSDYQDGVFSPRFRERLADERHRVGGLLLVDAHRPLDWQSCRPAVVTPNAGESLQILGKEPTEVPNRLSLLRQSSSSLLARAGADMVVTTVDEQGSLLHLPGRAPHRTRPKATAGTLGPCGAGDTFAATFALAVAGGASPELAADLAQTSADIVIGREGTSICTAQDLLLASAEPQASVTPACDVAELVREHRELGRRVVFTNGCFDILHTGHVTYLGQARQLGDLLIVGVNSDASVRRLKGPDRPVVPEQERARLVASLDSVDMVAVFDEDSPRSLIEAVRPDVYVKGGDYTPEMLPETELVRSLGGEVVLVDYLEDRSTTSIVERIRSSKAAS